MTFTSPLPIINQISQGSIKVLTKTETQCIAFHYVVSYMHENKDFLDSSENFMGSVEVLTKAKQL